MAEAKKAKLTETNGTQMVILPAGIHLDGDEAYVSRDEVTGDVVLSNRPSSEDWQDLFNALDAIEVPDEDWDAYMARIGEARDTAMVNDRNVFDGEDLK